MIRLIPIFLILITLLISPISAYTNLTECGELNITGETYYLIQNISTATTCMEITAENVILDCQGHAINRDEIDFEEIGIYITNNSVTVRNCHLKGWADEIYLNESSNTNIHNNTIITQIIGIPGPMCGISIHGGGENTIYNNNITQIDSVSIYLENSNYNLISNNTITEAYLLMCLLPNIYINGTQNIISYNNITSIWIVGDSNIISYNNIISEEEINSVTLNGSSNNITNNYISTISTGDAGGIRIAGCLNEIIGNEIYVEGEDGYSIDISDGINNKLYNNLFSSNNLDFSGVDTFWNTERQQGTRIYSVGNEIGGNYWTNSTGNGYSDTCADLNRDGFCDDAYGMDEEYDYYPLSNQYLPPSAPAPALIEIPESYCGDGTCDYELEYKETHISCPQDCPACGFEIYPSNLEFIIPPTEQCLTKPLKVRWTCEQLPTQYFFAIPPDSLITSPKNKQSISFKRYQKRYTIWYEAITNFTVCKIPTDTNELFQRVTTYIENQTKPDIYLRAGYEGNTINSYIPIEIKLLGQYTTECGNGICEAGENAINCPKDCKVSELPWYLIIGFIAILIMFVLYHIK